jgi:uncharacterized protein (DUF2225 family)
MNRKEFRKYKSKALNLEKYKDSVIKVDLKEKIRCPFCNRMFFKGKFIGAIQVKCPECRELVNIEQF